MKRFSFYYVDLSDSICLSPTATYLFPASAKSNYRASDIYPLFCTSTQLSNQAVDIPAS